MKRRIQGRQRHAHVGWVVAMQGLAAAGIACPGLMPLMAEQPLPGTRLLHGVTVS